MRIRTLSAVVGIVVLFAQSAASAWNDTGHMLAANIAYHQLDAATKKKLNDLLKHHPRYNDLLKEMPKGYADPDEYAFMVAATWPDKIRSPKNADHDTDHHPYWHYINFPFNLDGKTGPEPSDGSKATTQPSNILEALPFCVAVVKDKQVDAGERAKAVCWIAHLVGDVHQPLHTVAMFSNQFTKGDRGGNSFKVLLGKDNTNLHSVWDGMLGKNEKPDEINKQRILLMADPAMSRKSLKDCLDHTTFLGWAKESEELAIKQVYLDGKLREQKRVESDDADGIPVILLPEGYLQNANKVAKKQIVLAGYRLADTVTEALKDQR